MFKEDFKIYNCDEKKLLTQRKCLRKEILEGKNTEYFKVIDLECGTGKTIIAEETLSDMVRNTDKKALFVRERNEDGIKSAERINKLVGKEVAIAINSDTFNILEFNKIKKELKKYSIIIISHERYKMLSVDRANRKYFEEDRQILIIDEFLNITKGNELSLSIESIELFSNSLGVRHRILKKQYDLCVQEIKEYLENKKIHNTFFNSKNEYVKIKKEINKLKNMIKENVSLQYARKMGYSKNKLYDKIDNLKQFYNQTCVVSGNIIYCINRKYQYWLLENNLIIDAGARLNYAYKLNEKLFHTQYQSHVLDHSKWSFVIIPTNSNKNKKKVSVNYYDLVNNLIDINGIEDTLIIGSKDDENNIKAKYLNHFGNITGSNKYRHLNNIIIIHNPNIPYKNYVLEYLYFSNARLNNTVSWDGRNYGSKDEKVFRFKNKEFEKYRQYQNASNIYQAIKRINRNMKNESKVILFNNDVNIINRLVRMFKNCKIHKTKKNPVEYKKGKMDKYLERRKNNRYAMKFIKLCKEIMESKHTHLQHKRKNKKGEYELISNEYSKKLISEYLGINDRNNFRKSVLNDLTVIEFMDNNKIISKGQTIHFSLMS